MSIARVPFRFIVRVLLCATLTVGVIGVAVTVPRVAGAATSSPRSVAVLKVAFTVRNVNRSAVACPADGRTYTLRGDLVVPSSVLAEPAQQRAVTLYLHGLSFGEFFWNFHGRPGYSYVQALARAGQASLIVDRLGYGRSNKPNGFAICAGSRADIAHQVVTALRTGHYAHPQSVSTFGKVFLAGHSFGGLIAQIEAYSFGDIDGLVVISWTDVGQTALLRSNAAYAARQCAAGGTTVKPGGAQGYASFGPPAGAPGALFNNVDPRVLLAALPKLTLDPCGDGASAAVGTATDLRQLHKITVPVLLVQGSADALFAAGKQARQASLFTSSSDVRTALVSTAAHAITLERPRKVFAAIMITTLQRFEAAA